jgi:hypothetical protein
VCVCRDCRRSVWVATYWPLSSTVVCLARTGSTKRARHEFNSNRSRDCRSVFTALTTPTPTRHRVRSAGMGHHGMAVALASALVASTHANTACPLPVRTHAPNTQSRSCAIRNFPACAYSRQLELNARVKRALSSGTVCLLPRTEARIIITALKRAMRHLDMRSVYHGLPLREENIWPVEITSLLVCLFERYRLRWRARARERERA